MSRIILEGRRPLFVGGTRRVFQHPHHAERCIKVLRPDRTGAVRRAQKSGWKRRLPASAFDDQQKEIRAYDALITSSRDLASVWQHVPEYFGSVTTDSGIGVVTRLYRNADGSWPRNLEQCLPQGLTPAMVHGLRVFARVMEQQLVLTRDLLPHNMIAVTHADASVQILVVDGIGTADFIPLATFSRFAARAKVRRKLQRLEHRLRMLLPLRDQEKIQLCKF